MTDKASIDELNQHFELSNKKNRFEYQDKSHLAKMGFQDNDMKTPEHDKIIDILMDDGVISKIANLLNMKTKEGKQYDSEFKWNKKEEFIVKGNNDYIIGYVDIAVFSIWSPTQYYIKNKYGKEELKNYYNSNTLFIEVKTKISSFGELIRQINTYREFLCKNQSTSITYEQYCEFVVIAPNTDDRQRKRLKEADISLIDIKELI